MVQNYDPPLYLEEGSRGPAINLLLTFLQDWAKERGYSNTFFPPINGTYDGLALQMMKWYQETYSLDVDGGCGPQTRQHMLEHHGFNLAGCMKAIGAGDMTLTKFVQPPHEQHPELFWAADIEPDPNEHLAQKALDNARQKV